MNVAFQRNIGSFIHALPGLANFSVTAGGTNDDTALTGLTIDRNQIDQIVLSGLFAVEFNATLGDMKSCAVSCTFEDSADGSSWDAYDGGPPAVADQTETIQLSGERVVGFKCQFGGARRYIRAKPKFNCSAADTDTVAVRAGVWVIGGADALPMSVAAAAECVSS
jgi:hypothetical protein